jgi:DNA-directed RNA polymerase
MKTIHTFAEILRSYQPLLKSLSKRYAVGGDLEESYQIAQIALYEACLYYDPNKGAFGAYAKRLVKGRLLNAMRKEITYKKRHVLPSTLADAEISWEERLADFMPDHSLRLTIKMALAKLTEKERKAIVHCFLFDRTIDELARREGVSPSTAITWKRRGLAKLKRLLSQL